MGSLHPGLGLNRYHNCDNTCNKSCNTCTSLAGLISIVLCVYNKYYYAGTCNLQPITEYRSTNGISPLSGISRLLTEHVPDDSHHGRGAAHFLATFIAVVI